jgi:hypothetical protein
VVRLPLRAANRVPSAAGTDDIIWFAVKAVVDAGLAKIGVVAVVLVGPLPNPDPSLTPCDSWGVH